MSCFALINTYACAVDAITEKWFSVTHYMTHRKLALVECVQEVRAFYQLLGELDAFLSRLEPHLEGSPSSYSLASSAASGAHQHQNQNQLTREQLVELLTVASAAHTHASFADLQARFTRVKKLFFDEQLREFESDYESCLLKWTKVNIKLYASSFFVAPRRSKSQERLFSSLFLGKLFIQSSHCKWLSLSSDELLTS